MADLPSAWDLFTILNNRYSENFQLSDTGEHELELLYMRFTVDLRQRRADIPLKKFLRFCFTDPEISSLFRNNSRCGIYVNRPALKYAWTRYLKATIASVQSREKIVSYS
jgi:hypothetical protein